MVFSLDLLELLGTPGYLAPEMLKVSVEDDAPGYGKEIDMYVSNLRFPVTCMSPDLLSCTGGHVVL